MPYNGTIKQGTPVTVEVGCNVANGGSTALTVAKIVKKDRFTEVDTVTAAAGQTATTTLNIGAQASRLVVMVHLCAGGTAIVKLTQGIATKFEDPISADTEFVYDIIP